MKKLRFYISQLAVIVTLSGCISVSHFQSWSGPQEFVGKGGAFVTKNGIDIYSFGTPNRKCRILGVINTTTISRAELMMIFGNSWSVSAMVKEAKKRGGNAVVFADDATQMWLSGGTDANGNAQVHTYANRDCVAVLVKYEGDVQEQNLTPEIEAKLVGHWLFTPTPEMPLTGHLDFYFLPNNRCKMISTLIDRSGQPLFPASDQEGRYYFDGNRLVTWNDKKDTPSPPKSFWVTDTQLIIQVDIWQFVFERQT
jgi:hypothetical protein